MHNILIQSYNIVYLDTIFKYCIIKYILFFNDTQEQFR